MLYNRFYDFRNFKVFYRPNNWHTVIVEQLRGLPRVPCLAASLAYIKQFWLCTAYLSSLHTLYTTFNPMQACSDDVRLTLSTPAVPNCCCWKGSAPYWSSPPFLFFDIRALWRSVLSARVPECQKLKMVGYNSMVKSKALTGSAVKGSTIGIRNLRH